MIFVRAFFGIAVVVFGFIIYPTYIESVIDPIVALATSMSPGMNILEQTYLQVLPLVIFLMILFFGIMYMLGKAGGSKEPQ